MLPLTAMNVEEPADRLIQDLDQAGGSYLDNMIMVIVVLALIVGLIVLTIRYLAHKNNAWFQARAVRHVGGIGVGQNKSVQLVRIGESIYVVGVGNDVRLLDKIDDPAEVSALIDSLNTTASAPVMNWIEAMRRRMPGRKQNAASAEEGSSPEAASFQELFHSKIQKFGKQRSELGQLFEDEENKKDDRTI